VAASPAAPSFDVSAVRNDFPLLARSIRGRPLVYLDNASTTQKPRAVLEAERNFYETRNANIHRGVHLMSQEATELYDAGREAVRRFLHAREAREIVFVRGTTEAINLVAYSWGRRSVGPGDEILLTVMEHHSNIVPWQILCEEKGARLRVVPMDDRGELIVEEAERLLGPRTKLFAFAHVSNVLGTVNPVRQLVEIAHRRGVRVLVDGAQAVAHLPVDVQELGCDFYAFSGHKAFGPTGIGVLYGRAELLEAMPPFHGGGDMIRSVTFEKTIPGDIPQKFEAGTPHIAGVVGLEAALAYLERLGYPSIEAHELELLNRATEALEEIPGVRILGKAHEKASVISFVVEGVHAHDVGTVLDVEGIAIRAGHHCAQPLMDRLGVPATARVSFAVYNTAEEVDRLARAVRKVLEVFR
jgi:cysteine desulfurase/selenocysteine lyase